MNKRTKMLIAGAMIIALVAAGIVLTLQPDDPKTALGDTAAAALLASIIVLAKIRRDHWLS